MRTARGFYKVMMVLRRVLVFVPGVGADCPVCGRHLPVTSTAFRDKNTVKRYHRCEPCDWAFQSVEQITESSIVPVRSTRPVPAKRKTCEDKGKRKP